MIVFDPDFWRDRRVFVTGHTGFKGAWLVFWLSALGARVTGFSLPPHTDPSLFALVGKGCAIDLFGDIIGQEVVAQALADCEPEIVIHMAAQALVQPSYADPVGTYATNVMGTAHVLQAVRAVANARAVIVVTSDKVYANDGAARPFAEHDRLGGRDPYSNSKACVELITDCFRRSFLGSACRIATARAGNVIGGGDWSPFRIVPDIVAAYTAHKPVMLRNPRAVRPWQHVLDPLAGYLMLAQALITDPTGAPEALNFGPDAGSFRSASELVQAFAGHWKGEPTWQLDTDEYRQEASLLALDATRARTILGWQPHLSFEEAVAWTADWYREFWDGNDIATVTLRQIEMFSERIGASQQHTGATMLRGPA
jgi:CDP-glucose 4,6-dehydratase